MKAKLTSLFLLLAAPLLHAQTAPSLMSYQGRVTDVSGVLIGNTAPVNRAVTFKLYSTSSGGTPLYAETQSVTISGGEFSVLIGNGTGISSLPGPSSPATTPYKTLSDILNSTTYTSLYLGVTVDDGTAAADLEISPRQQLVSGAFSLRSKVAESVAGSAITTAMVGDQQVTTNKIASGAVDSSRIADLSIESTDIKNNTITATKLDTTTIGNWTPTGSNVYRSNNVGIGEANPGFPLTFASTIGDKISLFGSSGAHYGLGIQGNLFQIHTSISGADVAFGYGTSASMTETMRIKGNGNVGIGTTSPGERLVVVGTATADRMNSNGTVRARGGNYGANGINSGFTFDGDGDSDGGMFSGADGLLQFYTNGAEKVRITAAGSVGIGTANPTEKMSIQDGKLWFTTSSGNGDTGGIGGTMAGNDFYRIFGAGDNNAGVLYIDTYDDANDPIIFRQVAGQPGGATTAYERMRINSDGRVGINTTDTSQGNLSVGGYLASVGSRSNAIGYAQMYYSADRGGIAFNVYNTSQGGTTTWRGFSFDGDSNIDYFSDRNLKKDIVDAEPMLDRLMQLPFRRFHWKDSTNPNQKHEFGVIAQEVQPLFPDIVGSGDDGILTVGYGTFATIACKAVQELKVEKDSELSDVQAQLDEKDQKIADLEERLAALEKLVKGK